MLCSIRQCYHFCIQAKYEGIRNYKAVLDLLENVPNSENLLDIGCAEGTKTIQYANKLLVPLENVYGVELKPEYVKQAKEHFRIINVNLEHDTFPFRDQEIGAIICNQVLEHLKNIFLPLSEMDRVLKIGGHLIIGIPNLAALHNRFFILFGKQPMCNIIMGPHIRCFTHKGFLEFIKQNTNFELQSISAATLYPLPYPVVKYCAKYFPGLASYTFYLLKKVAHKPNNCGWRLKSDFDTCF
ncbi:MAG: class I SAM-dependent methyltransferase [Candidatus Brocadiales bacterium]|nr:class I SAM-dependent methyltransferase [Candidatus Brocadiales bacterium]